MMKKFKINLLPIIGMMVAVATLAFTAPKDRATADLQWFEVDANGSISSTPTAESTLNANNCLEIPLAEEPCAVGFEETDLTPEGKPPVSTYEELENENINHQVREKEEM